MTDPSLLKMRTPLTLALIFTISFFSYVSAQEVNSQLPVSTTTTPSEKEITLSGLQQQARAYREQGLRQQRLGHWEEALSFYQKAISLDPLYAAAFNDLGVVYEATGDLERAEDSYQEAISVDPKFADAYTNLALLYENLRDLKKAAYYWKKRSQLGSPYNPWSRKARKRYEEIRVLLGEVDLKEQEIMKLTDSLVMRKNFMNQNNQTLSEGYFEYAQACYKKHDYVKAMKFATDALLLDSSNKDILAFIEKLQVQLLSK